MIAVVQVARKSGPVGLEAFAGQSIDETNDGL
jgi:hypothetical protein